MGVVLAIYGLAALGAASVGRRLGARAFWIAAIAPAATIAWLARHHAVLTDDAPVRHDVAWVGDLGLRLDVRVDAFSYVMVALVSGIGLLVFAYARYYFEGRNDAGQAAGLLVAFAAAMIGIVVADNLLLLYVAWELTSVTSYFLIGLEHEKPASRAAALQAILVTGAGGLAMLGGFVVLGEEAGTYSLSALLAAPPTGVAAGVGVALVLAGALTKSAQFPFHAWLPGAMAAPTPISAYLHSATMVKAGVYLVARFAPVMAIAFGWWRPVVVGFGAVTMIVGGVRALREHDLKLLLAYGTVSQLGFLVMLFGAGRPDLTFAGVLVIVAHAMFKAALFLVVGIIDHAAHTRDLRKLSGLGRALPGVFVVSVAAVASMAGLPPLFGFVAKEAALEGFLDGGADLRFALVATVAGSVLTFAYGARFLWGAFARKPGVESVVRGALHEPAPKFVAPAAVLAVASLAFGALPALLEGVVSDGASALDTEAGDRYLALWHGFNVALSLSVVTFVLGLVLFQRRTRVERFAERFRFGEGSPLYRWSIERLNRVADRVTATVQNGSLPVYLGVILVTAIALPGGALLVTDREWPDLRFAHSGLQVGAAVVIAAAAFATTRVRRRFAAVLLLGAVGYGVAVLFVVQGAPDVALTQLLVESLLLVMFVLVLRVLPEDFRVPSWKPATLVRVGIAVAVGVFVTAFALIAAGARTLPPVSGEYIERAYPDAGGRNVVNVILVDFRALDTLGEITVLLVAALGIASLVRAGRGRAEEVEP